MTSRAWFVVLALAAGCGKKTEQQGQQGSGSAAGSSAPSEPASGSAKAPEAGGSGSAKAPEAAGSGSAAPTPEAAARAGKRLGIASDEEPEVVTEELITALAEGKSDLGRLVDPAKGLVTYARVQTRGATQKVAPTQEQLCGEKATAAAMEMVKTIVDKGGTYGGFWCSNTDLATKSYASCTFDIPSEGVAKPTLVFVPADSGLRLALLLTTETGSTENQASWDAALAAVSSAACK